MKLRILLPLGVLALTGCGESPESGKPIPAAAVTFNDDETDDCCKLDGAAVGREYDAFIPDIRAALPGFAAFGRRFARRVELLDGGGVLIGRLYLAPAGKYARTEGFNGYVDTAVVLTPDDRVAGVAVGKNEETPRWMERVRKAGFLSRWNGRSVGEAARLEVDAVTSATYSSTAVKDEVRTILNQ